MLEFEEIGPIDPPTVAQTDIDLIYKIEGTPNELDVFELARVLEALGKVLEEGYRIVHPNEGELAIKVKPFESGSFIMDIAMHVRAIPGVLFFLASPEILKYAKDTLEALGFIQKVAEKGASLMELLRKLRNGKPEKIEQTGPDEYKFHAGDGAVIPVNSTVHALYNSPVINNYTINIVAPAERESVDRIRTYLKGERETTETSIDKEAVKAVRAYAEPPQLEARVEVLEDTTTKMLHPKSGNYGQTTGTWSFTIAGSNQTIKARITDSNFLAKYSSGSIRFYQSDLLKVRLMETQKIESTKTSMVYEIIEVLEYQPAHPSAR